MVIASVLLMALKHISRSFALFWILALVSTYIHYHSGYAVDNMLSLTSGCTCLGCTLTCTCTVVGRPTGITLWRGSALDNCRGQEISLLHYQFTSVRKTCNNGSIVAKGQELDSVNGFYTSQLNITVTCDMIGKTVECIHDDIQNITTVDSLNITVPDYLPLQNISVMTDIDAQNVTFQWNPNLSDCPAVHYNILTSNCGSCPTNTTQTKVSCTGVPVVNVDDNEAPCIFALQTVLCENIFGYTSDFIYVQLIKKDSNIITDNKWSTTSSGEDMNGYIAAVTLACLFAIFMTISIAAAAVILSICLFKCNTKTLTALELAANSRVLQSDKSDVDVKLHTMENIFPEENVAYGHI